MALEGLRGLFCGCCRQKEEAPNKHIIPDEHSLLIPQNLESNISYTDEAYLDNQKLQERLGTIVRAKEGKMVNLGSHIPFNLHNQTLLPSDRTISRSNSGSLDMMNRYHSSSDQHLDDVAPRRRYLQSYGHDHSHSRSPSPRHDDEDSSRSSRYRITISEQPRPSPILNVRLVGYTAPAVTSRGRTRERATSAAAAPTTPIAGPSTQAEQPPRAGIPTRRPLVNMDDASSLVMSWGD